MSSRPRATASMCMLHVACCMSMQPSAHPMAPRPGSPIRTYQPHSPPRATLDCCGRPVSEQATEAAPSPRRGGYKLARVSCCLRADCCSRFPTWPCSSQERHRGLVLEATTHQPGAPAPVLDLCSTALLRTGNCRRAPASPPLPRHPRWPCPLHQDGRARELGTPTAGASTPKVGYLAASPSRDAARKATCACVRGAVCATACLCHPSSPAKCLRPEEAGCRTDFPRALQRSARRRVRAARSSCCL